MNLEQKWCMGNFLAKGGNSQYASHTNRYNVSFTLHMLWCVHYSVSRYSVMIQQRILCFRYVTKKLQCDKTTIDFMSLSVSETLVTNVRICYKDIYKKSSSLKSGT